MDVFKTLIHSQPGAVGSNVAITGGSVNGTNIGATTPGTGAFTTLTASGTFTASGDAAVLSTTASTSTTTGALTVAGGVGVAGAGSFGGNVTRFGNGNAYSALQTAAADAALTINSHGQANFRTIKFSYGASPTTLWDIGYFGATTDTNLMFSSGSGQALLLTAAGALTTSGSLTVQGTQNTFGLPATASALATNSTMTFELTSNTSLKVVVRGTDGTTRSATLTLAP